LRSILPGSVGVACSPILSVSLVEVGCEPVLNLAATPDEDGSIICTVVDKTIPLTFLEKLMYVSYTTDRPGSSVGHPEGALAKFVCGFF
jgi:hypothetical protein